MNRPPPTIPVAIPEAELVLDVNTAKPSKEEIAKAIQKQKNGKAPGPDGISAEILKGRCKHLNADVIQDLCEGLGRKKINMPEDWKEGHLIWSPRRETWQAVTTTGELPCYQFQEKSSVESSCKE